MIVDGKKRIWEDYQKTIADDRYFYQRSCIRQTFFPGSEVAFLKIMRDELGKDVFDEPRLTTCSGIGYHTDIVPFDTTQAVVARHFALMTENGYKNVVVSCVTTFGIYSEVIETWKHFPHEEEKARENLYKATGRTFEIPENVVHASDLIFKFREELALRQQYQLVDKNSGEPLKIVEHIGCHYAKMFPSKGVGGAEFPQVLAGMIESWGGQVIDYPERRHCCGFGFRNYLIRENRGYCLSNSKKKFESMEDYNPAAILTNCPGCSMFMDKWQYTLAEMEGKTYGSGNHGIPVFTYEELAGLLLGYDPWDLGLQMHQVGSEFFMDKIGIEYDPTQKYSMKNGFNLGKPVQPLSII